MPQTVFGTMTFLAVHVGLGPLLQQNQQLATFHAFASLALGLGLGMSLRQPVTSVACVMAYIVSSEVLWRMTGASVVWEFGKYAVSLVCLVTLVRHRRCHPWARPLAIWYFALLLPSAAITWTELPFGEARQRVSFNLSGPFALAVTSLFFSQVRFEAVERRALFVALLGPLISVASIAFFGIINNPDLVFGVQSSNETSGNFGPNQVSAALGLGALIALLSMLYHEGRSSFRVLMTGAVLFLAMQSALTMSRGGLYASAGAGILAMIWSLRDARMRPRIIGGAAILGALVYFVLVPRLDSWTDGKLLERFENKNLTGRDQIAANDVEIWAQYPVFGVGPGMAGIHRQSYATSAASHTELTRVLSEHGLFGFASLIVLAAMAIINVRRGKTVAEQAIAASLIAWAVLFMLNAGMRIAAPSFMIGLSAAQFVMQRSDSPRPALPLRTQLLTS
jgi:hypothetical protein